MCSTCASLPRMTKMIQVRNVPAALHRELQRRARDRGVPLTRYIQDILEREVARPPADEIVERITSRPGVELGRSAAELLREERKERD